MIEDNTKHYLQLNSPEEKLGDRIECFNDELRKFIGLFLYCRKPYLGEECNIRSCFINTNNHIRYDIKDQYAGLLGILSVVLPNRDLLFYLSKDQNPKLNIMASDLYKVISSAQNQLDKYVEFLHPKFQKSFRKMCQQYLNSYITYLYWNHIGLEDQNNLRFPPMVIGNILSFL